MSKSTVRNVNRKLREIEVLEERANELKLDFDKLFIDDDICSKFIDDHKYYLKFLRDHIKQLKNLLNINDDEFKDIYKNRFYNKWDGWYPGISVKFVKDHFNLKKYAYTDIGVYYSGSEKEFNELCEHDMNIENERWGN